MTSSNVKLLQFTVERSIAWPFEIVFDRLVVNWISMVEGHDIMKLEKVE